MIALDNPNGEVDWVNALCSQRVAGVVPFALHHSRPVGCHGCALATAAPATG